MITYVALLKVKAGKREEYLEKLKATGLIDAFRAQEGNVYYQVAASVTDKDCVVVTDGWTSMELFKAHDGCSLVDDVWRPLAAEYVLETTGYVLCSVDQ